MFHTLVIAGFVVVMCSPAFGQQYVEVFATSGTFDGDLGGLSGADTICTNAATAANLSGSWVAWLSTDTEDAKDRIPDSEYRLLDGTVIANDIGDLTDGDIDNPINLDEFEIDASGSDVWTGTLEDGTLGSASCNDWTGGVVGVAGDTDPTGPEWTEQPFQILCNNALRLFCFAAVAVPVEVQKFSVD